jgi:hypothetical protein
MIRHSSFQLKKEKRLLYFFAIMVDIYVYNIAATKNIYGQKGRRRENKIKNII